MVSREKVLARLDRLHRALRKLERIHSEGWDRYASDTDQQDIAERNLQIAIDCCVDIANHIVAEFGFRLPQTSGDAFRVLAEEGILPVHVADELAAATGMRNIIVHEYLRIDVALEFEAMGDLEVFRHYARLIAERLE